MGQINEFTLRLFYYSLLCYYIIYINALLLLSNSWGENRYFLFKWHRLPRFVNFDRQVISCSMFASLLCNCFVPFVFYHYINVLVVSVIAFYSLDYF